MKNTCTLLFRAPVSPWLKTLPGVIILFMPFILSAQQPIFTKVYYDNNGTAQAYSTVQASDGCYYIAGERNGAPMALKLDPQGTLLWAKRLSGQSGVFYAVSFSSDSSLLFAGAVHNPENLSNDIFCVKVNTEGDTVWTATIALDGDNLANSVQATYDGGVILSGYKEFGLEGFSKMILTRLDANGKLIWSKFYFDGTDPYKAYSVKQLSDSTFIAGGTYYDNNAHTSKMLLMDFDQDGNCNWAWESNTMDYEIYDVVEIPGGMMCLYSTISTEIGLLKTDHSGVPVWGKLYGFTMGNMNFTRPKLRRSDTGFLFVDGATWGPGFAVKTDPDGELPVSYFLYFNTIDAMETIDGGFLFTGNGPVLGVEMTWTDNPQIGVIQTDALLEDTPCSHLSFCSYYDDVVVPSFRTIEGTPAGVLVGLPHVVSDAFLATDSGCVAFIGAMENGTAQENSLDVFPNPSTGIINITQVPERSEKTISIGIFNSSGLEIFRSSDPVSQIDLTPFPSGLYLLRAETSAGVLTKRFLIRK